jgi:hypothetical protein
MPSNEAVDNSQSLVSTPGYVNHAIEIPNTPTVRLQTLDLARHIAIAPDGKRYVVATFDDNNLHRGYVTMVYPQQNGYLTLVRLPVCGYAHQTIEGATSRHITTVQSIQQGKLVDLLQSTK